MSKTPILSDEDKKHFMALLAECRRVTSGRVRMGVRDYTHGSVSRDALKTLAEMLEDSESLTACLAEDIDLNAASFDYGIETGMSVSAHPKPHERMTLAICFKFLLAVIKEKDYTIDHVRGEAVRAGIAIGEWAKLFADTIGLETEELPFKDPLIVSKEHHRVLESHVDMYHGEMDDD